MPEFSMPLFDLPELPFRGNTVEPRHAGWTGARAAVETWPEKQSAYLQLLNQAGALTDQEAAALLKWPLATVNSTRHGILNAAIKKNQAAPIVSAGFDVHTFRNAHGKECATKRTRWKLAAAAR